MKRQCKHNDYKFPSVRKKFFLEFEPVMPCLVWSRQCCNKGTILDESRELVHPTKLSRSQHLVWYLNQLIRLSGRLSIRLSANNRAKTTLVWNFKIYHYCVILSSNVKFNKNRVYSWMTGTNKSIPTHYGQ